MLVKRLAILMPEAIYLTVIYALGNTVGKSGIAAKIMHAMLLSHASAFESVEATTTQH